MNIFFKLGIKYIYISFSIKCHIISKHVSLFFKLMDPDIESVYFRGTGERVLQIRFDLGIKNNDLIKRLYFRL